VRHTGYTDRDVRASKLERDCERPDQLASVDQGIYGYLTGRNLAVLARERGDHTEAANRSRAVPAECRGDRDARTQLSRAE
jgi:hypothetical protein